MSARTLRPLALAAAAALALSGCGGLEEDGEEQQTLTVFAAASLTDSFTDLAEQFEEDHPDVDVQLSFAGSSALVSQPANCPVLRSAEGSSRWAARAKIAPSQPQPVAAGPKRSQCSPAGLR